VDRFSQPKTFFRQKISVRMTTIDDEIEMITNSYRGYQIC